MVHLFRGQGATEYLVLLAVVLIIALVSIALLGFFPGLASDARVTQSNSYWRGEARPFSILDHTVTAAGAGSFVVQNNDATGTITMTNFTVRNASYTTSTTFAPGETRTVTVSGLPSGSAGTTYDFAVNISYTTANGLSAKQYGSKSVVGKYS